MAGKATKKTVKAKKTATKKRGRPAFFKTAAEMQDKIDVYFSGCDKDNPPTVSGLAIALGFCDRTAMYDYTTRGEEFFLTVKKAIARISDFAEKMLLSGQPATGAIFWLKNHRWTDEIKSEVKTTVVIKSAKDLKEGQDL